MLFISKMEYAAYYMVIQDYVQIDIDQCRRDFRFEVGRVIETPRMRKTRFFNSGHLRVPTWKPLNGPDRLFDVILPRIDLSHL